MYSHTKSQIHIHKCIIYRRRIDVQSHKVTNTYFSSLELQTTKNKCAEDLY